MCENKFITIGLKRIVGFGGKHDIFHGLKYVLDHLDLPEIPLMGFKLGLGAHLGVSILVDGRPQHADVCRIKCSLLLHTI